MAAIGVPFPSWAYNSSGQPPTLVASQLAFAALGGPGSWAFSPFATPVVTAPFDPGFQVTGIRLQQMLIEQRLTNQMLAISTGVSDDPMTQIRPDILANDSSLTT